MMQRTGSATPRSAQKTSVSQLPSIPRASGYCRSQPAYCPPVYQNVQAARMEATSKALRLAEQLQEAEDHGSSCSLQSSGWGSLRGCSSSDDGSSPVPAQPLPHGGSGSGCCICGDVACIHTPRQALSMLEDVLDEVPAAMHDAYCESSSDASHCSTGSPLTAATRGAYLWAIKASVTEHKSTRALAQSKMTNLWHIEAASALHECPNGCPLLEVRWVSVATPFPVASRMCVCCLLLVCCRRPGSQAGHGGSLQAGPG